MADRVVFPQYNDPTPAPELASQQYETLGGAMDAYLDPEAAQPGSMRMFASNLYDLMGGEDDVVGDAENAARFVQGARDEDAVMGAISTGLNLADYIPGGSLISAIIPSKILRKFPEKAFKLTPKDIATYKKLPDIDEGEFMKWADEMKSRLGVERTPIKKMRVNEAGAPEYYPLNPEYESPFVSGYQQSIVNPFERKVEDLPYSPLAHHVEDALSTTPSFDYEMPLYRAQHSELPPEPIAVYQEGTGGVGPLGDAQYAPGLHAGSTVERVASTYGPNVWKLDPMYKQTPESVLKTYQTFATVPSAEMREKLMILFGPDIASEQYRHIPIQDLMKYANRSGNQRQLFEELQDLGIEQVDHIDWLDFDKPSSAITGYFEPTRISDEEVNREIRKAMMKQKPSKLDEMKGGGFMFME